MIDLSPQPQDKSSGAAELVPPRHDTVPGHSGGKSQRNTGRWHLSHEGAEAGIQLLSRWAGPVALVAALAAIGWIFFG